MNVRSALIAESLTDRKLRLAAREEGVNSGAKPVTDRLGDATSRSVYLLCIE